MPCNIATCTWFLPTTTCSVSNRSSTEVRVRQILCSYPKLIRRSHYLQPPIRQKLKMELVPKPEPASARGSQQSGNFQSGSRSLPQPFAQSAAPCTAPGCLKPASTRQLWEMEKGSPTFLYWLNSSYARFDDFTVPISLERNMMWQVRSQA